MLLAVVAGLPDAAPPRLSVISGHPLGMAIVGLAFLLDGPIDDLISQRRIHPVYVWGWLFALITGPSVRIAFAATRAWHYLAKWLVSI